MNRVIDRERVRNRICEALSYPVTLLRAPAGFGKSTALAQALDGRAATVRYTLTGDVNSPWTFLRGLGAALQPYTPSVSLSLSGAWERAAESKAPAEHLARWLHSHLEGRYLTVAIDQLPHAGGGDLIERILARLVELSSEGMRWIISTRMEFDLPVPRWLADGIMALPIDAGVLRFDEEEIARAARAWTRERTPAEIAEIARTTDGWPMGVFFALRSRRDGVGSFHESGADHFDVLAERVFRDRSEREREFLTSTCLLPQLDEDICGACGFDDAAQIVRSLDADAGLIFAESAGVRQYHDRFASYVQNRLRAKGKAHFDAVLCMAVSALEERGRVEQALRLVTQHGLRSEIVRLLDRYGLQMMQNGDDHAVQAALGALGAPSEQWSAQTLALTAISELRSGRVDTSDAWLAAALDRTEGTLRAEIAYRSASELLQRRRAGAVDLLAPHAADPQLPRALRISILSALASAHMQSGDATAANACIRDALYLARDVDDPAILVPLDVRASYVLLYSGHRERAKEIALRAAELAERSSQFQMACAAYSTLYAAAADDDDLHACLQHLSRFAENAAKSGNHRMQLYAIVARLELEAERGDTRAIAELRKSLEFFDVHYEDLDTLEMVLPTRALELAWDGRFDEAHRVLLPSASAQIEADRAALRWAEIALYAAACGEREEARRSLRLVRRELVKAGDTTVRAYRAQLFAAYALAVLGRARTALAVLDALRAGAPSDRMRALHTVVFECARVIRGESSRRALDAALQLLDARDGGGIGRALLAIPMPRRARSGNRSASAALSADADEFVAALLEQAALPGEQPVELDLAVHLFSERLCEYLTDHDVRGLEPWMHAFAERYGDLEALRAAISFAPDVLQAFLRTRGWDAERVHAAISDLRRAARSVTLRPRRRARVQPELLDEVDAAINALIMRLDETDPLTAEHSRAVSSWCARLARTLGQRADEIVLAARSGLIHDIGKLHTPIEVLSAPRALTADEWTVMRAHAEVGEGIVCGVPQLAHLRVAVRSHHERLDGKGYPDRTSGTRIPPIARLVAVADSFNAMIGRRPYRRPMPPSVALMELERHRGTQFDPEIADAMIRVAQGDYQI